MNGLLEDCYSILNQGASLLRRIPEEFYMRKHPDCFNSSIGGHIRHNLDHYWSLLRGYAGGEIDYDARARDTQVETNPSTAANASDDIAKALAALTDVDLERDVRVKMDTGSYALPEDEWSRSTVRRELQFLLSHTVHHYALIAVMCKRLGITLDKDFGVAPSTLKHNKTKV
ncbi:DinB family protein [Rubellicoccus peritrichatus]|uniref:DinB family protein n=1 Tax=Rubellicoccus peritrichatus TaxID=3080537 RepID=A0AAQ3L763_9BACT|nr:DinB family protein [Puniceicoccus sp. CR14]WOO40565.1 DinB family protein [Puniceicoccus sp. CR14]